MGKSNHEELLGGAPEATSNKQTVEDNLLGRPHVAEKSFAPEAKKDALAPKTPEERFAELQRLTSVYLSEDDEAMLAKAFRQHTPAGGPAGGPPALQRARDAGDLRAHRAPSRHQQHQVGARGPVVLLSGTEQVQADQPHGD